MAENGAVPGDHIRPKSLSKVGPDKAEQDIARLNVNEASADAHSSYTRTPQLSALGAFWHKPQPRDITKDFSKASSGQCMCRLFRGDHLHYCFLLHVYPSNAVPIRYRLILSSLSSTEHVRKVSDSSSTTNTDENYTWVNLSRMNHSRFSSPLGLLR